MGDLVRKDELESALAARRELGPEYEDEVLDAFLAKVERRLERQQPARKPGPPGPVLPVAIVSVIMAIPITAIALEKGGLAALLVTWVGIVLVNLAVAWRR